MHGSIGASCAMFCLTVRTCCKRCVGGVRVNHRGTLSCVFSTCRRVQLRLVVTIYAEFLVPWFRLAWCSASSGPTRGVGAAGALEWAQLCCIRPCYRPVAGTRLRYPPAGRTSGCQPHQRHNG
ncbi:hypothetical protein BT67DRAFT_11989 [Trichocladium antarcticum]|uniref:Uncharacterized protein n=1 Tax=Trichocladium antarcticum TaxID=1450529 RepID=A0AAN6UVB4_9PEZI|nr:hypothetical protein BT67DRAFT_11989 [Trichocladium antarcticum]